MWGPTRSSARTFYRLAFGNMPSTRSCVIFYVFISLLSYIPKLSASPISISSEVQAMMYLQRYGYMNDSSSNTASLISEEAVASAIRDFQRFAGLSETGFLDNSTLTMMNMPRCGVRDKVGHSASARRKKRYALQGSKWRVTDLTYRISKYPRRIKDKQKVDKEIARAFQVWGEVTPLKFIPLKSGRVHIDVRFEESEHGDGEPFDGPGRTLAHAFFPQYGGDAHFDDEEKWTIENYSGTNLFQVAAHEFGHSLGLSHSDVRASLMAPFYRGYDPNFRLDEDDVSGIQSLYGRRRQTSSTPSPDVKPRTKPDLSGAPDLCQDPTIDAATKTEDGRTYVFKGEYYWEILENGIADGYPRKIVDDWDGHPGSLDAALTWTNGKTFFFKGGQYWRFRNKKVDSGYPKTISVGFEGIPDNIDAAFVWSGNGKTYFFKGKNYWRFDSRSEPPVSNRYPQSISNWEGLPDDIDAALQWTNKRTYFFKGKEYYRFNDRTFSVDVGNPPYPRLTSMWWFDCRPQADRRSSLQAGDQRSIYIPPTIMPPSSTESDYDDTQGVDGNENMDVENMQQGEEEVTDKPREEPVDNGSVELTATANLLLVTLLTIFAKRMWLE